MTSEKRFEIGIYYDNQVVKGTTVWIFYENLNIRVLQSEF